MKCFLKSYVGAENTHGRIKYHCTAGLQMNWIGFNQARRYFFVFTETTESKPVKQETRSTVILPLRVSVVWNDFGSNPKRGSNIKTKKKNPP